MSTVLCFANMKGGVGKTTLCVNLGFELFIQGSTVLLVDNDPQFNATSTLLAPARYITECITGDHATIYEVYEVPPRVRGSTRKRPDPKSFFMKTWYKESDPDTSIDLLPSRIELYDTLRNPSHKEYLLDKFLTKNAQRYDYILIDCPPTPSVLTLSAFAASDHVIIPVTPDYYSTLGLPQFLGTLKDFKEQLHDQHNVRPLGVVFTNVDRTMPPDTVRSIERVEEALGEAEDEVPVFDARLSHLKVFAKTLWQSVPVQKISGRGVRGKTLATQELRAIAAEMQEKISEKEGA